MTPKIGGPLARANPMFPIFFLLKLRVMPKTVVGIFNERGWGAPIQVHALLKVPNHVQTDVI